MTTDAQRDPRTQPVAGDVLRKPWGMSLNGWTDHAVFNRCGLKGRVVEVWLTHSNMKKRVYRCFDLADWNYRLKTATIIRRGDQS